MNFHGFDGTAKVGTQSAPGGSAAAPGCGSFDSGGRGGEVSPPGRRKRARGGAEDFWGASNPAGARKVNVNRGEREVC